MAIAGKRDQKNLELGLAYADGLEKLGQTDQQMQVLATLSTQNPQNAHIQAVYGKKLLATGRSGEAIPVLKAIADSGTADWRILSALGSAYDQQGQYGTARETYGKALALQPNQISVLNNMGMSHALEGNLKQAEETLRSAMALPEGKSLPRLRQNLALVVGLQGRFEESRQIASEDLPPEGGRGKHGLPAKNAVAAQHVAAAFGRHAGLKPDSRPIKKARMLSRLFALPLYFSS